MLISPVFVFQPANASSLGLPPAFMTKFNETMKEPDLSTQRSQDNSAE